MPRSSPAWDGKADGVESADTLRLVNGMSGALAEEAERLYNSLREVGLQISHPLLT